MAEVTVNGKNIDTATWTPPALGFKRTYRVGSSLYEGVWMGALLDLITDASFISPVSGEAMAAYFALGLGINRLENTSVALRIAMRKAVRRLRVAATKMEDLIGNKEATKAQLRRANTRATRAATKIATLDAGNVEPTEPVAAMVKLDTGYSVAFGG